MEQRAPSTHGGTPDTKRLKRGPFGAAIAAALSLALAFPRTAEASPASAADKIEDLLGDTLTADTGKEVKTYNHAHLPSELTALGFKLENNVLTYTENGAIRTVDFAHLRTREAIEEGPDVTKDIGTPQYWKVYPDDGTGTVKVTSETDKGWDIVFLLRFKDGKLVDVSRGINTGLNAALKAAKTSHEPLPIYPNHAADAEGNSLTLSEVQTQAGIGVQINDMGHLEIYTENWKLDPQHLKVGDRYENLGRIECIELVKHTPRTDKGETAESTEGTLDLKVTTTTGVVIVTPFNACTIDGWVRLKNPKGSSYFERKLNPAPKPEDNGRGDEEGGKPDDGGRPDEGDGDQPDDDVEIEKNIDLPPGFWVDDKNGGNLYYFCGSSDNISFQDLFKSAKGRDTGVIQNTSWEVLEGTREKPTKVKITGKTSKGYPFNITAKVKYTPEGEAYVVGPVDLDGDKIDVPK